MAVLFQNEPIDVSGEFRRQENHFYVADRTLELDPGSGEGTLGWKRLALRQRVSYHQLTLQLEDYATWEDVPPHQYDEDQRFPFRISFPTERTARLQLAARPVTLGEDTSSMVPEVPAGEPWELTEDEGSWRWAGPHGSVVLTRDPWRVELRDAEDRLLTRTNHLSDSMSVVNTQPTPFCFIRSSADLHRHVAASFALGPGEGLFGGGESFTRLDKRGQKLVLWTSDAYGAQTSRMYKPVPFFLSSQDYGMFAHTSATLTLDLGHGYDGAAVLYLADDALDLFLFLGEPGDVVSEYTALTGRSPVPPAWSFGLWMGRQSYGSEEEVRKVAGELRRHRIPSDVIHVDTDWTETPFANDFRFSPSRFPTPERMLSELLEEGFRLSLWQLPYFHPKDDLHTEAIARDLVVRSGLGKAPVDDAVLDFTNPDAVGWYQEKLAGLLEQGVAVFTTDFGEAAPLAGLYSGSASAFREHNLYPLRYNRAVAEVTERVTGANVQYSRSAWAGSQRYPLHFGGDAENTDSAMAATLRAGLSLGLCGFTFWSHFIGGFPNPPPPGLYRRWLALGAFTSHMRCHGAPPREPWEFGPEFMDGFRSTVELRYELMPYIYAQAHVCAARGHPMMRPLFFDHPGDPTSWLVEDAYMFGTDVLVAPLFDEGSARQVYLPPGTWLGLFDSEARTGGRWHTLAADRVPAVVMVRDGAAMPRAGLAQCTDGIDWGSLELSAYRSEAEVAEGVVCLPDDSAVHRLRVVDRDGEPRLEHDPLEGRVNWRVTDRGR